MQRARIFWIVACIVLTGPPLLEAAAQTPGRPEGPMALPSFVGTWHVLIHYQVPGGSHPERWKWDERVWVIEPSQGGGLEWVEHAIVSFEDPAGRFENLGTNRARRLIGAWEPNERQQREIASGLAVSTRGMRRKQVREVEPGLWRSDTEGNRVGQSSSGLGYNEVWSIRESDDGVEFAIDPMFTVSGATEEQSGGATVYRAERMGAKHFSGQYLRSDERAGRFAAAPTHILVPESDDPNDPSKRPAPLERALLEMIPDKRIQASVPLVFTVLRPFHYYADRSLVVDSTPPGAELDVAYLRRGSQLLYRRGRAPLEIVLPTRLQSASSDRLLIRGFLPGHERTRHSVSVDDAEDKLHLELQPLQNQIVGVAHGSLVGRSVLEVRSDELPSLRVAEDSKGWTVVLVRTGLRAEQSRALGAIRDPAVSLDARQLGDDFVLRVTARPRTQLALRHQQLDDASRGETRTRLVFEDASVLNRVATLREMVEAMQGQQDDRCDHAYEESLRAQLEAGEYPARLGRDDHPYRPTLRAALRRLGAVRNEALRAHNGDLLGTRTPLEFELAWSRSAEIEGYLIWLEELARRIEAPDDTHQTFRSLAAPDLSPAQFTTALETAAAARDHCHNTPSS